MYPPLPQASRRAVHPIRTGMLAFVLAATFLFQGGVTLVDLGSMIMVVTAGAFLFARLVLAGAILAIVGAAIIALNATVKAIFNAATDQFWMIVQIGVCALAITVLLFAVRQISMLSGRSR